jgi:putative two-component system response regulator
MTTGTRVLVVDDQAQVRRALDRILELEGYVCQQAGSVSEAQRSVMASTPELVLCDIDMPGGSGLGLVDWLAEARPETAILMVTACDDLEVAERALTGGAHGYITKPFDRNQVLINVADVLRRRQREAADHERQVHLEQLAQDRAVQLERSLAELERSSQSLDHSYEETVWRLACAAEYRDPETASHLERMSQYSHLLARRLGLDEAWCELLRLASPMHDVGKLGIPDEILMKPGRFSDEDRAIMNRHAEIGHRILAGSSSPLLQLAASVALTHHEWWDGSGYPRGLRGHDIPIEGRIVAVADVFDALTTQRRYKPKMSFDEAVALMTSERGRHFDPELLDAFVLARADIERIQGPDEEGG